LALSPAAKAENATVAAAFGVGAERPGSIWLSWKLLATSQNVTFAGSKIVTHDFTGVVLWDLLQSTGIIFDQSINNDILCKIVIVTGSDGYETVFSAGEIDPEFGGHQIMVAYAKIGQPLGPDRYPLIVAPGDKKAGRFVKASNTFT
jgi:hypothetical protein